jgi:hypothetical protein
MFTIEETRILLHDLTIPMNITMFFIIIEAEGYGLAVTRVNWNK